LLLGEIPNDSFLGWCLPIELGSVGPHLSIVHEYMQIFMAFMVL